MLQRNTKAGLLYLGRKRPGFDEEWGSAMAARVSATVESLPFEVFECPVKGVDDKTVRKAVSACAEENCDTLVVLQTTMSDGRLAPILAQQWSGPMVLWATPEKPEGDMVSSCSLVGTHLFASLMARMEIPFEVISGAPEDNRLQHELIDCVGATGVVERIGSSKIGLVGAHAPGFINMHADPYEIDRHIGAQLFHMGLHDLLRLMDELSDSDVAADIMQTLDLGLPLVDLQESDLETQSRYYLALKSIMAEENLDALALRCWPELPNLTGQWPYLAMVRLADEGAAITMEGDVDGAIGMLILRMLGLETGYLTDWLEHDDECITTWHGGGTPECLAEPAGSSNGRTIARHFNSSKPAVVDGWIAPGKPVSIMRIWSSPEGYSLLVREAETVEPTRNLRGTNGRIRLSDQGRPENPHELFDLACHSGMPHHLTVFPGHHSELLRLTARALGMRLV